MTEITPAELQARLDAALQGQYRIERLLGVGGMAMVYLAEDLKHRRQVAVKVLRPELAASIGTDRFLREIELAARLQHPHIVPVYDSGAGEGLLYYVMPCIEGESLRELLARQGRLGVPAAIRIVREVGSALDYAHQHGIVHRDVKPENIMLTGGHAVVTDFGIARAAEATGSNLTGIGVAIGTPAYMSPEQATASEVDGRTDQYSLASVFYEMVAGKPAFSGATPQAVLTANITGQRPRLGEAVPDVPQGIDGVTQRAMARDPAERYPNIPAFLDALEERGSGAPRRRGLPLGLVAIGVLALVLIGGLVVRSGGAPRTVMREAQEIAILPFSVSGTGVEIMGEGMSDLLAANLGTIPGVRIIEPRRVMKASAAGADAMDIARQVGAASILQGSVVGTGTRVRINAELLSRAGVSLGRAQVEGASDSLLTLVDNLSVALMREIWRSSEPHPTLHVSGLLTGSVEAMRAFLEGEQHYRRAEWDSAGAAYTRAIRSDSTFAMAYHRLALTSGWSENLGSEESRAATAKALWYADRLPPRERFLLTAYGLYSKGSLASIDSMRKYVRQYPEDPDGWYYLGEALFHSRGVTGADTTALRKPFESVLQLDSTLTAAIIHPIELSLEWSDEPRFNRYLRLLRLAGAENEVEVFTAAGHQVFGTPSDSGFQQLYLKRGSAMGVALISYIRSRRATGDSVLHHLERLDTSLRNDPSIPDRVRQQVVLARGMTAGGLGRMEYALALADSMMPVNRNWGFTIRLTPVSLGFAPPGTGAEMMAPIRTMPNAPVPARLSYIMFSLSGGDTVTAAQQIAELSKDTASIPALFRGPFIATKGWFALVRGDTVTGIADMRRGIDQAGFALGGFTNPLLWEFALALSARPDTRAEGIQRLRHGFESNLGDLPYLAFSFLPLGRAREAAGDRSGAAEAYGLFLRLWDHPDAGLQPLVKEAREGLQRVTGEK